tara:strand:- start:189 stop:668 length:480 start_codon:yes stop_codon:yes gene_type:complete
MKNFTYIAILFLFLFSCKSTKTATNNQLDISKETIKKKETKVKVTQLSLNEYDLTLHSANPKKPVKITDEKGNTQTFDNVSKINLKKKTEEKKDSTVKGNLTVAEKETDNSTIIENTESVSDAKNFKGIFGYSALIIICLTVIFLIIRFRIKSKKDISV